MLRKSNYRDLDKWRKTKREQKKRYYEKTRNGRNHRQRWAMREINMVMEHKITDTELATLIGRSVGSIQIMRSKQKKSIAQKWVNSLKNKGILY